MTQLAYDEQCPECGRWGNRGLSVDAVIVKQGKVLLVLRGAEPCKGMWALPGGYVGWDESTEQAVIREVKEETHLQVMQAKLIGVYSAPHRHPSHAITIAYRVEVKDDTPRADDDAQDTRWFALSDLPDTLAFDHGQIIADARALS